MKRTNQEDRDTTVAFNKGVLSQGSYTTDRSKAAKCEQVRRRLWQSMNIETVLVGHAMHKDVNALGMWHSRIVDSAIMTSEAVFLDSVPRRTWGLKDLTKKLLGYDIQVGKRGHSALEDARATRGVVLWCLRNPEQLKSWAAMMRGDHPTQVKEREEQQKRLAELWMNEPLEQT